MASSVPFALLASAQLLAVAGWVALAAGSLFPVARSWFSTGTALGGGCLAVADALTGSHGSATSTSTTPFRAAGALLLALGWLPALPAAVRAVAGARVRPRAGWMLAGGLALAAAAALLPMVVRSAGEPRPGLAEAILAVRGLGALLILGWAAATASTSLLAKVVGSIMAGLVLASVVVAAVVGTVVNDRLGSQQSTQVTNVARAESASLQALTNQTVVLAKALAVPADEGSATAAAQAFTSLNTGQETLTIEVRLRRGRPLLTHSYTSTGVSRLQLDSLATSAPVLAALTTRGGLGPAASANLQVLEGADPTVVLATVATPTTQPTDLPAFARVFAIVADRQLLVTTNPDADYNTTLIDLGTGRVAGSSLPAPLAAALAGDARVRRAAAAPPSPSGARAELSSGASATLGLVTLRTGPQAAALLVVSVGSAVVSGTQQVLLQVLFLALLAAAVLVAVLALLMGARIVEPVRSLTLAAERIGRGDLAVTTGGSGRDEVGRLSRTFDAMTGSLLRADRDLRSSVEQETALRARLQTVLESIAEGLVVAGADGCIESVNPAAEALLGPAADVLGRPLADAVRGVALTSAPGQARLAEGLLSAVGGRRVPVIVSSAELADGSGRVLVLRDTTREREVERMKTEFLSNVSHELRTPLTPIRGYAGILASRELPPEKVAEYAGAVLVASQRLTRVVDLLVEVAALDAGRVTPEPARVALDGFVDARLAAWRTRAPARAADLRRRIPPGLPDAYVDVLWLGKAVDELLDNAVGFSAVGSPITLAAGCNDSGSRVRLEVRDAGEGIPEDGREALFLDFEQADGSATRTRDGLGLGLPFVRRVAEVVGLELSVLSAPGRGSVFTLEVAAAPGVRAAGAAPPRRARRRTSALLGATAQDS